MANLNKVMLIGRLTRDPECRSFANGGKVAAFGFAVTNRRKNPQNGQWEDEPMFLDCKAFNRGDSGKLADIIEQYCKKGGLTYLEGKLHLEQWDDKNTGQKRSKHVLYVDVMQLLGSRDGSGGPPSRTQSGGDPYAGGHDDYDSGPPSSGGGEPQQGGDIPF